MGCVGLYLAPGGGPEEVGLCAASGWVNVGWCLGWDGGKAGQFKRLVVKG